VGTHGLRRIAEGREAEIFAWEDGAVLKLYRTVGYGELEAAALATIGDAGGPAPRLIGRHEVGGRPGLIIERVDGIDMLAQLERTPWRIVGLAKQLAIAHAAIHRLEAPAGLPATKELLAQRIENGPLPAPLRDLGLEHASALPEGDRLCHGDFHPGNVLVTADGLSVIDWPLASRGHPAADHARTALLMAIGDPPPVSAWMRTLIMVGRRWFSRVYAKSYRRLVPADDEVMRHAQIAHVAARVTEGIEVEIPKLTAFLERAEGG
jgi:aminoglycoside phosphotransferase (APT) family kinase protein